MSYYWEPGIFARDMPPPVDWLTNYDQYGAYHDIPMKGLSQACIMPSGENLSFQGFESDPIIGGDPTIGTWGQTLPTTHNFGGRIVIEQGEHGTDNCFFPQSTVPDSARVKGSAWAADWNNYWGVDYVGFPSGTIKYYRDNGRAGCQVSFPQQMLIGCANSLQQYATHQLSYPVDSTRACSGKDSGNTPECTPYP